jgi:hypothetical protein
MIKYCWIGQTHQIIKSHAQVLLDGTGAPDNQWFLAQDYLAHVHNRSANRQLNWKISEQVERGGNTRHIPYADVLLV